GGYSSPVNLSCTGAMPATCTLQPKQATPPATYTLTAGGLVGDYSFNAHAVGTDGNAITRDASVTLHVVDFNLTEPSPNALSVGQGGTSGASTFQVTAAGSFAGTVTLSCSAGLPAGAACLFSPSSSVNPTSSSPVTVTLTVTAGGGTPLGGPKIVTVAATGAGAPSAKTQTFALRVTGPTPDFAIAMTATPNATVANQNVTWNGTLTASNGYTGSVTLTCVGAVPGTWWITPATLTPTASGVSFTVTLGSATTGAFNFTIQGTQGTLTHATPTETLTVGTDVTWTDTGSTTATVLAGQSVTYPVSAVPGGGATAVTLTIATTGPNLGTASQPRAVLHMAWMGGDARPSMSGRPRTLPLFTLAWVVLVGIVGIERKRRGKPRLYGGIVGLCLGLGLMALFSCGGVAGSGTTPPPVTVNPGLAT